MVGLTLLLLEAMNKIGSFFYVGMAGMANQRLVRAFLTGKDPSQGQGGDASSGKAQVVAHSDSFLSLQRVAFAYPGGDPVLQNLDLEIKPGEWVAICGPSGTGKSTLIEVLKGNLLPSQGTYYLQGRALEANSSAWFADQSALVQQHTWIFTGTIRSNLMMVAPRASEDRLWECLEKVRLAAEVRAFAQGLDTPVGEDGYALSGGQAQRLSLARALLSQRELLLLDEPTSQIDLESEAAITQALAEIAKEKTIVLLTHRGSALEFADRVLYLQDGALKEVVR